MGGELTELLTPDFCEAQVMPGILSPVQSRVYPPHSVL